MLSAASPADEITFAVVAAVYVLAAAGTNVPKPAGAPSVRLSVAGTVAPPSSGASTP